MRRAPAGQGQRFGKDAAPLTISLGRRLALLSYERAFEESLWGAWRTRSMFGFGRREAADSRRGRGFLTRLARDSRGNTLAIVGAALIPLAAMIGSGVDMS